MDENYPIQITRKKIKNIYLRIRPDGTVMVSAPRRISDKVIRDFINSKSDWIEIHRTKVLARQAASLATQNPGYVTGEIHYLWGKPYTLLVEEVHGTDRVIVEKPAETAEESFAQNSSPVRLRLLVPPEVVQDTDDARIQRQHLLTEFYREQLKEAVPPLMSKYIGIVGKTPTEWRIKNMKTKWGTCNVQEKRIWLSLNLAKKDIRCLEYVIAHELTHLHEANHSKTFWMRMDCFYPEWREIRKLLNG